MLMAERPLLAYSVEKLDDVANGFTDMMSMRGLHSG